MGNQNTADMALKIEAHFFNKRGLGHNIIQLDTMLQELWVEAYTQGERSMLEMAIAAITCNHGSCSCLRKTCEDAIRALLITGENK